MHELTEKLAGITRTDGDVDYANKIIRQYLSEKALDFWATFEHGTVTSPKQIDEILGLSPEKEEPSKHGISCICPTCESGTARIQPQEEKRECSCAKLREAIKSWLQE